MKTRNLNSGVVSDTGVYDAARLNPNLQTYAAKTLTFTNALCEFADDFFIINMQLHNSNNNIYK